MTDENTRQKQALPLSLAPQDDGKLPRQESTSASFSDSVSDSSLDEISEFAETERENTVEENNGEKGREASQEFDITALNHLLREQIDLDDKGQFQPHKNLENQPRPKPEPDVSFDFQKFLQQLRFKSATPVVRYIKSFLYEFSRRQWTLNEQIRIVHNFFNFICDQMRKYEPWKLQNAIEFKNATEGIEKLIMNKLYTRTFSPFLPETVISARNTGHTEDLERDLLVREKMRIYTWIEERHLDILETDLNEKFFKLSKQEIEMIDNFRAPKDKIICIMNCCKVVFGFLRHIGSEESADNFVPVLIYVLLKAKPPFLVSNINYITRFRDPSKFSGESEYYISSLSAALSFIESIDKSSLNISHEEFERNVEKSIAEIAKENKLIQSKALPVQTQPRDLLGPARTFLQRNSGHALSSLQRPINTISRMIFESRQGSELPNDEARAVTSEAKNPKELVKNTVRAQTSPGGAGKFKYGIYPATKDIFEQSAKSMKQLDYEETLQTISAMFPNIEKQVVEWVVDAKNGRVGPCVDALLEISQ